MPNTDLDRLTPQQRKWFASVRDGLELQTGRSLAEWVAIARTCPETGHRAQLKWFKDAHGLLQNRASYVLGEAFPFAEPGWSEPDALSEALWTDPGQRALFKAVEAAVQDAPDLIAGQRKGYSAWSRHYQFAAVRPVRGGARLGLAVGPDADPRLSAAKPNEGWSERLKSVTVLTAPGEVDVGLKALLKASWERS
jgi:hypothetical protein